MEDFDKYRVNGRINIDKAMEEKSIRYDEAEQRGARENKFWFNKYSYMYKDVYEKTYEDYAELIAYEIAKLLGIKCAQYDLAIYNGNRGVITKSVVDESIDEEMKSGTEIINSVFSEYLQPLFLLKNAYVQKKEEYHIYELEDFFDLSVENQRNLAADLIEMLQYVPFSSDHLNVQVNGLNDQELFKFLSSLLESLDDICEMYNEDFNKMKGGIIHCNNLYDLWSVIDIYCRLNKYPLSSVMPIMQDFTKMFVFDIITSQGDRHADNWSLIIDHKNHTVRLAALYDNSAICALNREKAIQNINEHVYRLKNENLNDRTENRLLDLISSTINKSFSGLKVDYEDVIERNKNPLMIQKYVQHSSNEFIEMLENACSILTTEKIEKIFTVVENNTKIPIPPKVKVMVVTVLENNVELIKNALGGVQNDVKRI